MNDNYYDVLGIAPNAGPDQIESAYQDLMSRLPPDSEPDSVLARYLREAYETLCDPRLRAAYDHAAGVGKPAAEAGRPATDPLHDDSRLLQFLEKEAQAARTRRSVRVFIALLPLLFILIIALIASSGH